MKLDPRIDTATEAVNREVEKTMTKGIVLLFATVFLIGAPNAEYSFPTWEQLQGPYLGQKPPGKTPEIFAPGIVSTEYYNHSSVTVSPDGREIYWAMGPLDHPLRIYCSKWMPDGWSKPEIVSLTAGMESPVRSIDSPINTNLLEGCPFMSPDGSDLVFDREGLSISFRREDGSWGAPRSLGIAGTCPYVSPDGKYPFLKMGMGYNDVYWVDACVLQGN